MSAPQTQHLGWRQWRREALFADFFVALLAGRFGVAVVLAAFFAGVFLTAFLAFLAGTFFSAAVTEQPPS